MRVTRALERAARIAGGRIGTIEGATRRTWTECHARVRRLAGALTSLGVSPGDRVAILAGNGADYFELWYAIPAAGAAIVPMNTRLAVPELAFQLRDAGVAILLYGREFAEQANTLAAQGAVTTALPIEEDSPGALLQRDERPLPFPLEGGDHALAGIFYTGGTTGLPKGVMLSHANLTAMAMNLLAHIDFRANDVLFHAAPMFHLADIGTLFATMAGGTHVFHAQFDAAAILADTAAYGVSHCFTVPVVIERLATEALARGGAFESLRYLGYGGSAIAVATLDRARTAFPGVRFVQGYGQTEFPAATFLSPEDHLRDADPRLLRSCGRACVGYDIRILDENGDECPRGEIGEIVGRGDNVMMGYLGRPEETAEVLRDGWIHTRDAGYMDEAGYLFITDRLKDMIVTGAENVYSIEVENCLAWHPAVRECAVIGVADSTWGERVHAIVVMDDNAACADPAMLAAFCRERIAAYKVPKSWHITNEPLPRSAAGKVLKNVLRDSGTPSAET